MKTYSEKLKDPRWQKKRLQIFNRDKFTCKLCGDTETTLHVHHKEYISGNDPWDYPNKLLVTICEHCHKEISTDEFKDVPYNEIKIYKSVGWHKGGRIMFTVWLKKEFCNMSTYDSNNNFIIGFIFDDEFKAIVNILKASSQ